MADAFLQDLIPSLPLQPEVRDITLAAGGAVRCRIVGGVLYALALYVVVALILAGAHPGPLFVVSLLWTLAGWSLRRPNPPVALLSTIAVLLLLLARTGRAIIDGMLSEEWLPILLPLLPCLPLVPCVRSTYRWRNAVGDEPLSAVAAPMKKGTMSTLLTGASVLSSAAGVIVLLLNTRRVDWSAGAFIRSYAGWALFAMAGYLYNRAKRATTITAAEARTRDGRSPVLFLRSFRDDETPIGIASRLWNWLRGRARKTFEEALTERLWAFGPVIALGRPGETLPPVGAAREYLTSTAWRPLVEQLVREAAFVVVVAGTTGGVEWELGYLRNAGVLGKTVVAFSPERGEPRAGRWRRVAAALEVSPPLADEYFVDDLLLMCFPDGHKPLAFTGRDREDFDYGTALLCAIRRAPGCTAQVAA